MMILEVVIDIVFKTGFIFGPLFILGIIGWFLALDVWLFTRHEKLHIDVPYQTLKKGFLTNNFSLIEACFYPLSKDNMNRSWKYRWPSFFARPPDKGLDFLFLRQMYQYRNRSKQTLLSVYNDLMINYFSKQYAKLDSVKIIAAVAPLLGLLGTVNGMVSTFKVISNYGNSNASLLAEGISEALLTTQAGLTISFPFLLVHIFLRLRVSKIKRSIDKYHNECTQFMYA